MNKINKILFFAGITIFCFAPILTRAEIKDITLTNVSTGVPGANLYTYNTANCTVFSGSNNGYYMKADRGIIVPNGTTQIDQIYIYFHGHKDITDKVKVGHTPLGMCQGQKICEDAAQMKNTVIFVPHTADGFTYTDPVTKKVIASYSLGKEEITCFLDEALKGLRQLGLPYDSAKLNVIGHSGGGKFIYDFIKAGYFAGLTMNNTVFLEACYGSQCKATANLPNRGNLFAYYQTQEGDGSTERGSKEITDKAVKVMKVNAGHNQVLWWCFLEHLNNKNCNSQAEFIGGTFTGSDTAGGTTGFSGATSRVVSLKTPNGAPGVADEQTVIINKPQPRIQIPGLKLSDINSLPVTQETDESGNLATYLYFPYIGEYLAAIYRYVVAISSIIAVAMIMLEGFKLITSRGNSETVTAAKNRITQALTGLIIALSSYMILYLINPNLVEFKSLKVQYVSGIEFDANPSTFPITTAERASTASPVVGSSFGGKYQIFDFKQYKTDEGSNLPFGCDGSPYKDKNNANEKAEPQYIIWHQGCEFVSTVNVLNSFFPGSGNPGELIKFFHNNSAIGRGCKISSVSEDMASQSWFQSKFPNVKIKRNGNLSQQGVVDEIGRGNLVVMCVGQSAITKSGHCFTIYGYENKNGTIYATVSDPGTGLPRCAMDETGSNLNQDFQMVLNIRARICKGETFAERCTACGGKLLFQPNSYPLPYIVKAQKYSWVFSKS